MNLCKLCIAYQMYCVGYKYESTRNNIKAFVGGTFLIYPHIDMKIIRIDTMTAESLIGLNGCDTFFGVVLT